MNPELSQGALSALITLAILAIPLGIAAIHGHLAQNKCHNEIKKLTNPMNKRWRKF